MLDGYVIAVFGSYSLIGRRSSPSPGTTVLSPVYELQIEYMMDGAGNFGIQRRCLPVLGSAVVNSVTLPDGAAVIVPCSDLSHKERETLSESMKRCDRLRDGIRAAESGIVTAPAAALKNPSLIMK